MLATMTEATRNKISSQIIKAEMLGDQDKVDRLKRELHELTNQTSTSRESKQSVHQPKTITLSSSCVAYQHKHALHRLRRLKKRSPHRDLVISFVPRLRTSIINRLDFFNRYSKQEQEVLSCFDFLDELVLNYCDGGQESPIYSQKLYQSMIYEFI
jgi:hypothetical protein